MKFAKYCITNSRSMTNPEQIAADSKPSVYLELDDGSIKVFFPNKSVAERENLRIAEIRKERKDSSFEHFSSSQPAYEIEDRGTYSKEKEQEINKILSDYGYPIE